MNSIKNNNSNKLKEIKKLKTGDKIKVIIEETHIVLATFKDFYIDNIDGSEYLFLNVSFNDQELKKVSYAITSAETTINQYEFVEKVNVVYIVQTVREHEGSWIEKVFLTEKSANDFISNDENKNNDELKISEYMVE
jgi:hypothetical protein